MKLTKGKLFLIPICLYVLVLFFVGILTEPPSGIAIPDRFLQGPLPILGKSFDYGIARRSFADAHIEDAYSGPGKFEDLPRSDSALFDWVYYLPSEFTWFDKLTFRRPLFNSLVEIGFVNNTDTALFNPHLSRVVKECLNYFGDNYLIIDKKLISRKEESYFIPTLVWKLDSCNIAELRFATPTQRRDWAKTYQEAKIMVTRGYRLRIVFDCDSVSTLQLVPSTLFKEDNLGINVLVDSLFDGVN